MKIKSCLTLFCVLVLLCSCSNEKKSLFEQANNEMRSKLKAPSSAKFQDYDDHKVIITDSIGKGNPLLEGMTDEAKSALASSAKSEDSTYYSIASVDNSFESQNSFGVMMAGKYHTLYQKWHYKDGSKCEWKLISYSIE